MNKRDSFFFLGLFSGILLLGYNVSITGLVNVSLFVEHNKQLQSIQALEPFWNTSRYIISDRDDKTAKYNRTTAVVSSMNIVVARSATVEIVFDDGVSASNDDIKDAITSPIESEGSTVSNIEIIRKEDGTTIVKVTVVEEDVNSVTTAFPKKKRATVSYRIGKGESDFQIDGTVTRGISLPDWKKEDTQKTSINNSLFLFSSTGNDVETAGATQLSEALKTNTALTALDLGCEDKERKHIKTSANNSLLFLFYSR